MIKQIEKVFKIKRDRGWKKIYFIFDIHETILYPSHNSEETYKFYPFAKETLQLIKDRGDIVCILWSCTSNEELDKYIKFFETCYVYFDYVNENPEIVNNSLSSFDKKIYCNVGFDDKFGFDAENDWEDIYNYFYELRRKETINEYISDCLYFF